MKIFYFLFLFIFFGCGPSPYYSDKYIIEGETLSTSKAFNYTVNINDIKAYYDLHLLIDHKTSYRYENIYFKIRTKFPDKEDREEQLSINLADKKGVWVGKCNSKNCKTQVYLLEEFKFATNGQYIFEIQQFTRDENLAGLNSLELQLFKNESD